MRRALTLALTLCALLGAAGALAAPPPRHAVRVDRSAARLRHHTQLYGRQCVQVAPREFVCPLPYPGKR